MDRSVPATQTRSVPELSVIIPARDEAANLGDCLRSLAAQTGVAFEVIVVDDGSTDRTREIAQNFAQVRVVSPGALPAGWTGKNNAVVTGARHARAEWFLFTDADTVHLPGSLARALDEAKREKADLLSYSPEQVVGTFAERAVMPVVFSELAAQYPPHKVRDQSSGVIAANGQYILARRAAYESAGGHGAVATEILEDVALARLFRNAGLRVYFRYGGDAVRTRMYRNWPQLREGWTKNLALLFPHPILLAIQSLFLWFVAWQALEALGFAATGARIYRFAWIGFAVMWLCVYIRVRTAHFSIANNLLAMAFGLPIFAYLLVRSNRAHASGQVSWRGRVYEVRAQGDATSSNRQSVEAVRTLEGQGFKAKSQELGVKS